jgi:hypothetical protein
MTNEEVKWPEVRKLSLSVSFDGTQEEQERATKLMDGADFDTQLLFIAQTLWKLDHFGVIANYFREQEKEMSSHVTKRDVVAEMCASVLRVERIG